MHRRKLELIYAVIATVANDADRRIATDVASLSRQMIRQFSDINSEEVILIIEQAILVTRTRSVERNRAR